MFRSSGFDQLDMDLGLWWVLNSWSAGCWCVAHPVAPHSSISRYCVFPVIVYLPICLCFVLQRAWGLSSTFIHPPFLLSFPPSASLGWCHLIIEKRLLAACLQETLLTCFKKRRVPTMYVRCCCSQFINSCVHMCRLKVFPEGWKALRLLVLRKRTWLIVAAFVKSLIQRALPGCF